MAETANWTGHIFEVHPANTRWGDVAGIYIFCATNELGEWFPLYVGQTDSFRTRFADHEKWPAAVRMGATHIHLMVAGHEPKRMVLERRLIEKLRPPLNDQLR